MFRKALITSCVLAILGCHNEDSAKVQPMNEQPALETNADNLSFSCVHEVDHLPAIDPDTDHLFQYGRWLQKQPSPQNFKMIGRMYRIAAANGNYKAANNLHRLISAGSVDSSDPASETIDLVEGLIKQNIPSGYYAMGHYLELGYGVKEDKAAALKYFRKAADSGNPDAQFYVGDLLNPADRAPEIARQMWQCAVDQNNGQAANVLGVDLQQTKSDFVNAVKVLQKGVFAGDTQSAFVLQNAFDSDQGKTGLYAFGLPPDAERSRRYGLISKFIDRYDGRNPKVPDIDKIVPLPPTPLPAWDGTFQWEKEFKSAKAPEIPSEALMKKLAQAKGLDPATGLPLAKAK